jgi:hypothetical protein
MTDKRRKTHVRQSRCDVETSRRFLSIPREYNNKIIASTQAKWKKRVFSFVCPPLLRRCHMELSEVKLDTNH